MNIDYDQISGGFVAQMKPNPPDQVLSDRRGQGIGEPCETMSFRPLDARVPDREVEGQRDGPDEERPNEARNNAEKSMEAESSFASQLGRVSKSMEEEEMELVRRKYGYQAASGSGGASTAGPAATAQGRSRATRPQGKDQAARKRAGDRQGAAKAAGQ